MVESQTMNIPFVKAHAALNDFLLTWATEVPEAEDLPTIARAICHRNSGIGADGWMLVRHGSGNAHGAIQLINSDGSPSEISGNGTRCAAAMLVREGHAPAGHVTIRTGAGLKEVEVKERDGNRFVFEMNMGRAKFAGEAKSMLKLAGGPREVTILNVGNPQCAVFVDSFDLDWRALGAEIERHPYFPARTNVSFVRVISPDRLEVRFFERGAGETQSSGTGSTGAAAAARERGLVGDSVTVETSAGQLAVAWRNEEIYMTGPAELTAQGLFYWTV
jgi:diaminopimelate epimerase